MKRHTPDVVSLVFGVAFVGLAGLSLTGSVFDVDVDAKWVVPVLLLVLGAAGLLGSLSRLGREAGTPADE